MKLIKLSENRRILCTAVSFAVCFLFHISSFSLFAQNNPYEINDQCYELFLSAEANFNSTKALDYCEQMRQKGESVHDDKAIVLAYVLEMEYYANHPELMETFLSSVEKVMEVSMDKGYSSYYYYAYSVHVGFLLSRGESISALYLAEKMLDEAKTEDNIFGQRSGYYVMAHIYMMRGDTLSARRCYDNAKKYSIKDNNEDLMDILLAKSETYSNPDSAIFYINNARKYSVSPNDTLSIQKSICFAYGAAGNANSYRTAREAYKTTFSKYGIEKYVQDSLKFEYYDALLIEKDYQKAREVSRQFEDRQQYLTGLRNIAIAQEDYKSAYHYFNELVEYNDSLSAILSSKDVNEVDARFRNDVLIKEKEHLEITSEKTIIRQKTNFFIILFGVFFVFMFIILDFAFFYIKQKNTAMENQKALTEDLMITTEAAQKAKEMALKAKDEAIKANNMKTTFVQNMSHEIRTPLNAIVGFSQLMAMPEGFLSNEEKQQYGKYILSNSNLLTMLIDDILNINDIESGNYKVNLTLSFCNEMCREAMNSVEYRVPPGVDYQFTSEVDDSFQCYTDERRIRQILINFLTNACKHTESGQIIMQCKADFEKENVIFSVTDTGTGIPSDKVDSIFERFTKLDSFKQGAGLGLNICRMIAEKLGGEVCVDTSYSDGARFLLIVPFKLKMVDNLACEKL